MAEHKCPNCKRMIRDRKAIDACHCPHCQKQWVGPAAMAINAAKPQPVQKPAQKVA